MKMFKLMNEVLFIFFILFSSNIFVEAKDKIGANICVEGYVYYFETTDTNFSFSKLTNLKLNQLQLSPGKVGEKTINVDGTNLEYSFVGRYSSNGDQKLSSKCYTYMKYGDTITDTETNNGYIYTNQTTNYKYQTKQCGNKYGSSTMDLSFSNIGSSDGYFSNKVDASSGKISLKIVPTANSKLLSVWNRLGVSISYNGGDSKGTCTVKNQYIECTGISPYKSTTYVSSGKTAVNSPSYTVYLYLNGITENDFDENVSSAEKQGYINSCGGSNGTIYLGNITTQILSEESIKINNPKNSNAEIQALCNQIDSINANDDLKKAYVGECYDSKISYSDKDTQKSIIQTKLDNLKKMFVGVSTYTGLAQVSKKDKLLCTDNRMGIPASDSMSIPFESKIVYEDYEGYWGMICIEDYYVDGGIPSLVKAGTGVDYNNKVQVNKTCSIFQLKTVQMKPQCVTHTSTEIRCDHDGDGTYNSGDVAGGPSAGFDSCIESCDGGKYTQSCINSCYRLNYSDSRTELLSKISQSSFNFSENYNILKVADKDQNEATASVSGTGQSVKDSNGNTLEIVQGAISIDFDNDGSCDFCGSPSDYKVVYKDPSGNVLAETGYAAGCGATCSSFSNTWTGPSGCSNNPEGDYNNEISASRSELEKLEELAKTDSQLEDYSISFMDSSTGYNYKISGNTKANIEDKPQLDITKNNELSSNDIDEVTYTIGNQGTTENGLSTAVVSTVYNVELPLSRVKVDDAELIVVENSKFNKYFSYGVKNNRDPEYYTFNSYSSYDKSNKSLFTDGQRVFYTDLHSPLTNVLVDSGKTMEELAKVAYAMIGVNDETTTYELANNAENIAVTLRVGHFDENNFASFDTSGFSCYYGVYNFLFDSPPDDDPPTGGGDGDPDPTPTPTGSDDSIPDGLRYYYREIYLNSDENGYGGIFPNDRNPRWNWTGTVTNGVASGAANNDDPSYIVDPKKLIEDIESKGDSVFTDESEYDYVFTMDRNIIKKIRDYNNDKNDDGTKRTYLDFSLVGTVKDKKNYSQMISDIYSNLSPSVLVEISDCNNAQNGKC